MFTEYNKNFRNRRKKINMTNFDSTLLVLYTMFRELFGSAFITSDRKGKRRIKYYSINMQQYETEKQLHAFRNQKILDDNNV